MRLLHVGTRQLEEFFGDAVPPYAILSHTWGADEVTFQDLLKDGYEQKLGYTKIEGCCQQAIRENLSYVWVDTCCINKSSSAELSEAINSMFQWYQASQVCYAYLQDVLFEKDPYAQNSAFRKSRWFTRGWTLQELLAPREVMFFDRDWTSIFPMEERNFRNQSTERERNLALLSDVTTIPKSVLNWDTPLLTVSAASKFSWAAARTTTRVEDMAYSLLGLLGINIPLLYGEGRKAFVRLQEAVLSSSNDISVLAWGYRYHDLAQSNTQATIFARSAADFLGFPRGNLCHIRPMPKTHTTVTGHGVHIELSMILIDGYNNVWLGLIELPGTNRGQLQTGIAIVLEPRGLKSSDIFRRSTGCPPISISDKVWRKKFHRISKPRKIYLQDSTVTPFKPLDDSSDHFRKWREDAKGAMLGILMPLQSANEAGYFLSSVYPPIREWRREGEMSSSALSNIIILAHSHTDVFFATITNSNGEKFAVRIQRKRALSFTGPFEISLCALRQVEPPTALELFCNTKFRWKISPLDELQWTHSVSAKHAFTLELGHFRAACSTVRGGFGDQTMVDCTLEWNEIRDGAEHEAQCE